jgi:hypothetical protein
MRVGEDRVAARPFQRWAGRAAGRFVGLLDRHRTCGLSPALLGRLLSRSRPFDRTEEFRLQAIETALAGDRTSSVEALAGR